MSNYSMTPIRASEIERAATYPVFTPNTTTLPPATPFQAPRSSHSFISPSSTPNTTQLQRSISASASFPRGRKKAQLDYEKLDEVLDSIDAVGWSLNQFLYQLCKPFDSDVEGLAVEAGASKRRKRSKPSGRTDKHDRKLRALLDGSAKPSLGSIVDMMYQTSTLTAVRKDDNSAPETGLIDPDLNFSSIAHAHPSLSTWAVHVTGQLVDEEGSQMADKSSGLHLRARSEKEENLVDWDALKGFSMQKLHDIVALRAPAMQHVQMSYMCGSSHSSGSVIAMRTKRPPPLVAIDCIMSMTATRNQNANLLQMCRGVWYFAVMAPKTVFRVESRLGHSVSHSTTYTALGQMAKSTRLYLQNHEKPFLVVIDNTQAYARAREAKFGKQSRMITGLAGTAVEMEDVRPGAFDLDALLERQRRQERKSMTATSIHDDIDFGHLEKTAVVQFLQRLVTYVPELKEKYNSKLRDYATTMLEKHPINPHRLSKVHPLATNSANEMRVQGLHEGLSDFLTTQLGITKDNLNNTIHIVSGDGKTYNMLHMLRKYKSIEDTDFDAYRWLQPLLEIWHTLWTDQSRVIRAHWGDPDDPSSFASMAKHLKIPTPSDLHKVDYYHGTHLIDMTLNALILNIWELWFKTENLLEHFQQDSPLPSFEDLEAAATILVQRHATVQAYEKARRPVPAGSTNGPPKGTPWTPRYEGDEAPPLDEIITKKKGKRPRPDDLPPLEVPSSGGGGAASPEEDTVLANITLLLRDCLYWCEVRNAVSEGDPGRIWEVFRMWIFTFAGSGNPLYSGFLLEMYCGFKWEFGKPLSDTILSNWLVNLHGTPGHFKPMDLMQEHFNRWLEEMVQHKGKEFEDKFYREVVSPHVHNFVDLKDEMENLVSLQPRTKKHKSPNYDRELTSLMTAVRDQELNRRRDGRFEGHRAQDDAAKGFDILQNGKVDAFIKRTLVDSTMTRLRMEKSLSAGDLDGAEEELEADEMAMDSDATSKARAPADVVCLDNEYFMLGADDDED